MCLAIPGRIEELLQKDGLRMARVNFGGVRRLTCVEYAPAAAVGDYVLVHVGFAISVIDETEAKRQYEALRMSGELSEAESALRGEAP
ncbi:MAG TPA: HypC/HybG/HupF family hydrogenase formation chaperone [Candidatus Obscuribacterales bacterium]